MNKHIDISDIILEDERILLRPFTSDDLADLNEYSKVEGVGEMAGWAHHKSMSESEMVLNMFIEDKHVFAIIHKASDKVIGSLGVDKYNPHDFSDAFNQKYSGREIGYVLSKDYWNQGITTDAVKLVIEYLFHDEKLDFIICGYFKNNAQSERVGEKNGFEFVKRTTYKDQTGTTQDLMITALCHPNGYLEISDVK